MNYSEFIKEANEIDDNDEYLLFSVDCMKRITSVEIINTNIPIINLRTDSFVCCKSVTMKEIKTIVNAIENCGNCIISLDYNRIIGIDEGIGIYRKCIIIDTKGSIMAED